MSNVCYKPSTINHKLFLAAKRCLVGGVNSPVRSFKAVAGEPIFFRSARGSKIYSEDGRRFIDYCMSWGALILGHSHPQVARAVRRASGKGTSFGAATTLETKLAGIIISAMPSIERLRLTNSGTEAVMTAMRLARAHTNKDKIIRFEGSYHGHADCLLDCPGVPGDFKRHTLTARYNDTAGTEELACRYKNDIAALIVEPVAANTGLALPQEGFLRGLRRITKRRGIVLIFDEVITGFRLGFSGAQGLFGVEPDLTCLGKIIGGGLPIGAVGGRRDIMRLLAPEGAVYQAGTFSGNPLSTAAGNVTLSILADTRPYEKLNMLTKRLCDKIKQRLPGVRITSIGSMFSMQTADGLFKKLYHNLLDRGVYLSPSMREANFVSTAHTEEDISKTIEAAGYAT